MNHLTRWTRATTATIASLLWGALAFAQQQAPTVDINTTSTTTEVWYTQWWVWAAGIAVFLIVVIALTNRGGRSST